MPILVEVLKYGPRIAKYKLEKTEKLIVPSKFERYCVEIEYCCKIAFVVGGTAVVFGVAEDDDDDSRLVEGNGKQYERRLGEVMKEQLRNVNKNIILNL